MRCPTLRELPPSFAGRTGWPWTEEESPQCPERMPNGQPWPKISIITPSYNQGQFIEETIRSVLLQGYPNLEYIICDGGSKDNTVESIKKYEKWITYWVSEKDEGQASAINKGFTKATGEIFAWLNSDDLYCKHVLQKVASYWRGHPGCHFLTGDGKIVDATAKKTEYDIRAYAYSFKELLRFHENKYLPQPSVFFSREIFWQVGGLNSDLYIALDLDLWLRIRARHPLCYMRGCISKLRRHSDAKTYKDNERGIRETKNIVLGYFNKINILERLLIRAGLRFFYAASICELALREYFNRDRYKAISLFKKALKIHPIILISSIGLKVGLRLILPMYLKKMFFRNADY